MDNEFYISKKDWDKIISYAGIAYDEFNAEIGGMAVVIQDKDNDWTIKDPVILDQVITAGNTHLNKESLAPYYTKMAKKYSKKNFRFCWWHSHHTMQAFWSGTDLATIDEFQDGDFSFALVVNLKEEYKCRVSIWKPFAMHTDVELNILTTANKYSKNMVDEVKEKCSKPNMLTKGYHKTAPEQSMPLWSRHQSIPINADSLVDTKSYDYTEAYVLIHNLQKKQADGSLKYTQYLKAVEDFNNKAIEESSGTTIKLLTKEDWESSNLITTPNDHITEDDTEEYNNSYGYHQRWGI